MSIEDAINTVEELRVSLPNKQLNHLQDYLHKNPDALEQPHL